MIYDITMTIHPQMMVYKNKEEKKVKIKQVNFFEKEGHYESEINFNLHTGTHIDYPLHMIKNGDNSSKEDLKALIGTAKVFDLVHVNDKITYEDIKNLSIAKDDFVIFKTKNSFDKEFNNNFIFVEESAASYLVKKQVRGVGIDALGIERNQVGWENLSQKLVTQMVTRETLKCLKVRKIGSLKWWPQGDSNPYGQNENLES